MEVEEAKEPGRMKYETRNSWEILRGEEEGEVHLDTEEEFHLSKVLEGLCKFHGFRNHLNRTGKNVLGIVVVPTGQRGGGFQ